MDPRLKEVLEAWQAKSKATESAYFTYEKTIQDRVFQREENYTGEARFKGPGLSRVDQLLDGKVVESMILTKNRELWYYEMPKEQTIVLDVQPHSKPFTLDLSKDRPDEGLFSNISRAAVARPDLPLFFWGWTDDIGYSMELAVEDETTVRLVVRPLPVPNNPSDMVVEIWLDKKNYLPYRTLWKQPNLNEVETRITGLWLNVKVDDKHFEAKEIPDFRVFRRSSRQVAQ